MDRRCSSPQRKQVFLRLNSSKEFHKSLSILGKNSTCNTTTGRKRSASATRKSFGEFCSGSSMKAKSTRTNKPGITRFVRSNFLLTRNVDPTANSARSGGRSSFAKRKITTSSSASTRSGCFSTSTNEQTQSFPIFVKRNCATLSRKSPTTASPARTFASHVQNRVSTGESSFRSTKILSLTSGSTR